MKDFIIKTYGKGELAQLYNPNISQASAVNKLNYWINLQPALSNELKKAGLVKNARSYTPAQVKLIVDALGEP